MSKPQLFKLREEAESQENMHTSRMERAITQSMFQLLGDTL